MIRCIEVFVPGEFRNRLGTTSGVELLVEDAALSWADG